MTAVYKIREITTEKASGLTYLLVDFYDATGTTVVLTNDFLMQLRDEGSQLKRDALGNYLLLDGTPVPPALADGLVLQRETVKVDVPAVIAANIEAYWTQAEAKKWTGDHTGDASKPLFADGVQVAQGSQVFVRDTSDPHGVLARADVQGLKK